MALFAIWRSEATAVGDALAALAGEAHVAAALAIGHVLQTPGGYWHLAAFATRTAFYAPHEQVWIGGDGGACIVHGLIWREAGGVPRLLDAAAVAALLDRPGAALPADCAGEYAVARLHADGTLEAFGDAAGLHHIFHSIAGAPIVANRAGFVATLSGDWTAEVGALLWLPTIGYRVGTRSAYRVARGLAPGARLRSDGHGIACRPRDDGLLDFHGPRGAGHWRDLFDEGLVQAQAAIRLATAGHDRIELPITGGKDSRAILALCLAAGLGDRLQTFTRGYEGHPDVVAGRALAAAAGLPHARVAPHGSDVPAQWTLAAFVENLGAQAYQTDGMMGGWDYIVGHRLHDEVLITGHMGEMLKAYSKRPLPEAGLDPVGMVRLQAPFDPLDLLQPPARAALVDEIAAQMAEGRAAGAEEADLPDLFYLANRVPNWLGGIRGIKSFERQPVMPLGVPALMRLAFRLTAAERKAELVHYRIVERCAPALLAPAFALQSWDPALAAHGAAPPIADPIRPGAGAPPVFGNWQYSLNANPAIRAWLADRVAGHDHMLWEAIDRTRLRQVLAEQRIDYFQGIGLLGLVMAFFSAAGIVRPLKLGEQPGQPPIRLRAMDGDGGGDGGLAWSPAGLAPAAGAGARPIAAAAVRLLAGEAPVAPVARQGYLDAVGGAVVPAGAGAWRLAGEGAVTLHGWLFAPDLPAAQLAVRLAMRRAGGDETLAIAVADRPRGDLARRGRGDGRHGFAIEVDAAMLRRAAAGRPVLDLRLTAFDSDFTVAGGAFRLLPA